MSQAGDESDTRVATSGRLLVLACSLALGLWGCGGDEGGGAAGVAALGAGNGMRTASANPTAVQLVPLGKALFFDDNLSLPPGQSCADCHDPGTGFTGPDAAINAAGAVIPGAVHNRSGNRKPPSAAYAGASPVLHYDAEKGVWFGGMFWDGRATGGLLGDSLAEQAMGPFLNPLEMNLANAKQVCLKVAHSSYAPLFEEAWGPGTLKESNINQDVELTYERIARAIAAYERSAEVNPFNSKFDLFWNSAAAAGKDVTQITFSTQGAGSGATATATVAGGADHRR
jgi:cytochrome c peroxidase